MVVMEVKPKEIESELEIALVEDKHVQPEQLEHVDWGQNHAQIDANGWMHRVHICGTTDKLAYHHRDLHSLDYHGNGLDSIPDNLLDSKCTLYDCAE